MSLKIKKNKKTRKRLRLILCAAALILLPYANDLKAGAENYNVHTDNNNIYGGSVEYGDEEESDYYREIYDYANSDDLVKNIPESAKEYVGSDMKSGEPLRIDDVKDKFDFGFIFNTITSLLGKLVPAAVKNFLPITAFIILSALISVIKNSFESESFSELLNFILTVCLAGSVFFTVKECFELAKKFLDEIHLYMLTMAPVMASLSTVSGNVAVAAVNSAGLYAAVNIVEIISNNVVFSILQICYSLSLAQSLTDTVNLSGISSYLRSIMNWIFIFILTTLITLLFFQNILASSADTVTARTIKFTVSSFIPVIGGIIGEASRTVIGSMQAVKSVTGIFGIFVIVATLLPPLVTVGLHKFMLSLSGAFALILGMDKQAGFLKEMNSLLDMTLALMIAVSVVFIFSITIFIQTSVAL